jgi:hypothetical protein
MDSSLSITFPVPDNVTAGAALYSTLASVLCGFAFTAIVLLVVTWLDDSRAAKHVLMATGRALVSSFFGLLIMSVTYAAESTNASNNGLTISENTILAVGFVGVGVVLISTVVLMLDAADEAAGPPTAHWRDVALSARAAVCVLNLLVMGIGYNAVTLYEASRYGPGHATTAIDVLGWILAGLQLVATACASWMIIRRPAAGRYVHAHAATQRLVVYVGFGFPAGAAAGYLIVDTLMPGTTLIAPLAATFVLLVTFAATACTTVCLALTRPARIKSSSRETAETNTDPTPPATQTHHTAEGITRRGTSQPDQRTGPGISPATRPARSPSQTAGRSTSTPSRSPRFRTTARTRRTRTSHRAPPRPYRAPSPDPRTPPANAPE